VGHKRFREQSRCGARKNAGGNKQNSSKSGQVPRPPCETYPNRSQECQKGTHDAWHQKHEFGHILRRPVRGAFYLGLTRDRDRYGY